MVRRKKNAPVEEKIVTKAMDIDEVEAIEKEELEEAAAVESVSDTIMVALNYPHPVCFKLPNGDGSEREVIIKGNAEHLRGADMGILPEGGRFGLTMIKREDWEYISTHWAQFPLIKKGLLFANSAKNIKSAVAERSDTRHGLEPIDPKHTKTKEVEK